MNGIWLSASGSALGLWLFVGAPVQQTSKSERNVFSHKIHASYDIPCQTCHLKAEGSELASDGLLPDASRCLNCHDARTTSAKRPESLGHAVLPTRNLLFNHRKHLQLGNIAPALTAAVDSGTYLGFSSPKLRDQLQSENPCEACHRGLNDGLSKAASHLPASFCVRIFR